MTLHDIKRILVLIAYLKWLAVISKQVDAGGDFCGQWPHALETLISGLKDQRLEPTLISSSGTYCPPGPYRWLAARVKS
jgi:hypothetical protein